MRALHFLFYCFYCLTSTQKPDRAGAASTLLFLFAQFFLLSCYLLLTGGVAGRPALLPGLVEAGAVAHLGLRRYYGRPRRYLAPVRRYAAGEPHRLGYALAGAGLLLAVVLLPFALLTAHRWRTAG